MNKRGPAAVVEATTLLMSLIVTIPQSHVLILPASQSCVTAKVSEYTID